jgi:hypothetical protein
MQILTDSRRNQSHKEEYFDCFVRALATALEIKYVYAHDLVEWAGRKNNSKTDFELTAIPLCNLLHLPFERTSTWIQSISNFRPTLKQALKDKIATGKWIVVVRGHAFAIKDSVIFDKIKIGMTRRVLAVIKCP